MYVAEVLESIAAGGKATFIHTADRHEVIRNIHFSGSGSLKAWIVKNEEGVAILFGSYHAVPNVPYMHSIELAPGDQMSFVLENRDTMAQNLYINFESVSEGVVVLS